MSVQILEPRIEITLFLFQIDSSSVNETKMKLRLYLQMYLAHGSAIHNDKGKKITWAENEKKYKPLDRALNIFAKNNHVLIQEF